MRCSENTEGLCMFFESLKTLYRRCIQGFSGPDTEGPIPKTWQSTRKKVCEKTSLKL